MACADTGLFVYRKWKRGTISSSGFWIEGTAADVGRPGDIWGGHKGNKYRPSACELRNFCNWNNWYDEAGNWYPKPIGCGGTGPNQVATEFCRYGYDKQLLVESGDFPTVPYKFYQDDPVNFIRKYFNTLNQLVAEIKFKPVAFAPTNYFSDKVPGENYGLLKPLNVLDLYTFACSGNSESSSPEDAFCNNIFDQSGTKHRPVVCGGTDPDIFYYDAGQQALGGVASAATALQEELAASVAATVAEGKKKIAGAAGVLILLALLILLIIYVL